MMEMGIGVMSLKKIKLTLIISTIFLIFFNMNYLDANGDGTMNYQELIGHAKEKLSKGGVLDIGAYDASVSSVTSSINDANYVVRFTPKRKPDEPPIMGGGYSVYFKFENNEYSFIEVIIEQ